jgi:hypothetical protein
MILSQNKAKVTMETEQASGERAMVSRPGEATALAGAHTNFQTKSQRLS